MIFKDIKRRLAHLKINDRFVLTLIIGGTLIFIAWQLATQGVPRSNPQLEKEVEFLSGEVAALRSKLQRAMDRQALLERESGIQREANRLLRKDESRRQAELNRMQSQLDFYQRLTGSAGNREGLDIYRLDMVPVSSDDVYQFVLTLTQNIRRASIINGKVGVSLEGRLENRPATLYWSQLTDGNTPEPAFRFKYFQQLEGYIDLPQDFEPLQVTITLDTGQRRSSLSKSYDWNSLINADLATGD